MTFDEILNQMHSVPGYFWVEEAQQLYGYTKDLPKEALVVESGVLFGRSTSVLATMSKERGFILKLVENWKDEGNSGREKFWKNMTRLGLEHEFMLLEGDSPFMARSYFEDKSIDLFHLDTDHLYEHSVKELKAWIPRMKEGAIMAFHDYMNTVFVDGIKKAVDETDLIHLGTYNSLGIFQVPKSN